MQASIWLKAKGRGDQWQTSVFMSLCAKAICKTHKKWCTCTCATQLIQNFGGIYDASLKKHCPFATHTLTAATPPGDTLLLASGPAYLLQHKSSLHESLYHLRKSVSYLPQAMGCHTTNGVVWNADSSYKHPFCRPSAHDTEIVVVEGVEEKITSLLRCSKEHDRAFVIL